jgi:hypothetical protein
MSATALLIDVPGVLTSAGEALLRRMRLAGVPVLLFADEPFDLTPYDAAVIRAVIQPSGFPRPRALLAACREHELDLSSSWLVSARAIGLEAASQAGLAQAVFLGAALPASLPPIRVELARDLLDAPRVMVPKGGGCWHGH